MADISIPQSKSYYRITLDVPGVPHSMYINHVEGLLVGQYIDVQRAAGNTIVKVEKVNIDVIVYDVSEDWI